MYINSKFADIMKSFPREIFRKSVEQHKGDRYAKKFSSYSHLVAMIYSHLSESGSLHTIDQLYFSVKVKITTKKNNDNPDI